MATMTTYRTRLTGQLVAQCNECGTVCTYWDEDDLNEDGLLECDKCHIERTSTTQ